MSLTAAVIDALVNAGATAEQLAAAMKASLAEQDARITMKRAKDAERQRKSRSSRAVTVTPCDSTDEPSPFDKETLSPTPPIKEINIPTRVMGDAPARKGNFPVPEGCDPDDWRDLQANRKAKRLPMTPGAYRKILKDLADQSDGEWPPGRVLRHAAESGWAAIYDPRSSQGTRKNGNRPANDPVDEFVNPMVRAAIRREARSQDRGLGF